MNIKCGACGQSTEIRTQQDYHYTESGLDNIYLINIELRVCESCGAVTPRIPKINQLHETIAKALALKPYPLNGAEVRFLRKHLGLKAKEFAANLRVDVSTYSRWENGDQQIGEQSDALIRLLYFRIFEEKEGHMITESLSEKIASISEERISTSVLVNMNNPSAYQYQVMTA
jgi:putative zinc finger/helix-turn-helix YgiT family protein